MHILVSMCRNIFTMFAGYCGHAEKINSYNWTFQGNRNADMALSENEFDTRALPLPTISTCERFIS